MSSFPLNHEDSESMVPELPGGITLISMGAAVVSDGIIGLEEGITVPASVVVIAIGCGAVVWGKMGVLISESE